MFYGIRKSNAEYTNESYNGALWEAIPRNIRPSFPEDGFSTVTEAQFWVNQPVFEHFEIFIIRPEAEDGRTHNPLEKR